MSKHIKLFEEFLNESYDYDRWEDAVSEAASEFEHKHSDGLQHVASLIDSGNEEEVFQDELYSEASTVVADPAAYLNVEFSPETHKDLEKSSNEDGSWAHRCKEALSDRPSSKLWEKVIDFVEENGF